MGTNDLYYLAAVTAGSIGQPEAGGRPTVARPQTPRFPTAASNDANSSG